MICSAFAIRNDIKTRLSVLRIVCVLLLCLFSLNAIAGVPRAAASIGPIHSLLSMVMRDLAEPVLLLEGGQSPHIQHLNPSAIKQIAQADLIVRIGPDFEIALNKPIRSMGHNPRVMNLIELPGMQLLENRETGLWGRAYEHDSHKGNEHTHHLTLDPHLWLSPENAKVMISSFAKTLAQIDEVNAPQYLQNAQRAKIEIDTLKQVLEQQLTPFQAVPYMVFHDAYQYFEQQFRLNAVGAVTLSPERMPGAKTLLEIGQLIEQLNVSCLFHEPQFQPKLVKRIAEISGVNTTELDPLGAGLIPGPDLWRKLMLQLGDSLQHCLRLQAE